MGKWWRTDKIVLPSWMTLTFQGRNPVKSHLGPYLGSFSTNCHQILTQDSLGQGLPINQIFHCDCEVDHISYIFGLTNDINGLVTDFDSIVVFDVFTL